MRCEHYFDLGACVVESCEHWDGMPPPPSDRYQQSEKYQAHRERLRQERVVCVLGER